MEIYSVYFSITDSFPLRSRNFFGMSVRRIVVRQLSADAVEDLRGHGPGGSYEGWYSKRTLKHLGKINCGWKRQAAMLCVFRQRSEGGRSRRCETSGEDFGNLNCLTTP